MTKTIYEISFSTIETNSAFWNDWSTYLQPFIPPDQPVTTLYSSCHLFLYLDLSPDIKFNPFPHFVFWCHILPNSHEVLFLFLLCLCSSHMIFKFFLCFFLVARGYSWTPKNRRPEKLRDSLKDLEVPASSVGPSTTTPPLFPPVFFLSRDF